VYSLSFFLFLFLSLSLFLFALFFHFFSGIVPCPLLKLSRPFSRSLILFCVTRTLHRRSSVLECSTLYTVMFSRKSNPFSARPTNGCSRYNELYSPIPSSLFSLFVIRTVQNFIRFPLHILSSNNFFRYTRADYSLERKDPLSAFGCFSWLPSLF